MSEEMDIKKAKSKLAQNIIRVMPLIEEITYEKMMPLCLIGFQPKKSKIIHTHFATMDNSTLMENVLLEMCKQLLISKNFKITNPNE